MTSLAQLTPLGGADPGADVMGAASLASIVLAPGRGYDRGQVDELRRQAVNTVSYLQAQTEIYKARLAELQARLDLRLSAEELARGLVVLAKELRRQLGDNAQIAERNWAGTELAAIISASSDDLASSLAEKFPSRIAKLAHAPDDRSASWLMEAISDAGRLQ